MSSIFLGSVPTDASLEALPMLKVWCTPMLVDALVYSKGVFSVNVREPHERACCCRIRPDVFSTGYGAFS
jgi:hypothetical protein